METGPLPGTRLTLEDDGVSGGEAMRGSYLSVSWCLLVGAAVVAVIILNAAKGPALAYAATTVVVDDDGRATASDCNAQQKTFSSVQAAVDAAQAGSTVLICPGTYVEQVTIARNDLTLLGSGQGVTVLRPSAVPATVTGVLVPYLVAPIVVVNGVSGVTVSRLTVDGSVAESGVSNMDCPQVGFYAGIHFRNASGTVDSTQVMKVNSGTRCSSGIRSEGGAGGVSQLVVTGSLIEQSGDFGVVCIGPGATCTITGSTVRGRGPVTDQIQAGIAMRAGATATISGNIVRDHTYTLAQGVPTKSVGIFLVNADPAVNPHLLQENTFINNDLNVQRVSSAGAL